MTIPGYFMDSPHEAGRLAAKVNAPTWVDSFLAHSLSTSGSGSMPLGGSVLDVGCGPGVLLAEVSRRRPDLRCYGVDTSLDRLHHARRQAKVQVAVGDAEALPFPDGCFDLVFCRMLMEYLPAPERAMAELVRVCRSGGRVLVQDLDGQLVSHYPADPDLEQALSVVVKALARTGFDPHVGRKLFSLAITAGLGDIMVAVDGYHVIAGRVAPEQRAHWVLKLEIARPAVTAALGGESAAAAAIDRFLAYLDRPDTLTFSTQFTVHGTRPRLS